MRSRLLLLLLAILLVVIEISYVSYKERLYSRQQDGIQRLRKKTAVSSTMQQVEASLGRPAAIYHSRPTLCPGVQPDRLYEGWEYIVPATFYTVWFDPTSKQVVCISEMEFWGAPLWLSSAKYTVLGVFALLLTAGLLGIKKRKRGDA